MNIFKCLLITTFISISASLFAQETLSEMLFKNYLETENKEIAKQVLATNDGLYSLFCKALFAEKSAEIINNYSKFIEKKPKYGLEKAYRNRGIEYFLTEKLDSAFVDFQNALKLNPKDAYVYYFRGATFALLEMHEEAVLDYDLAIKYQPTFKLALTMRGNSYYALAKYKKALEDYSQVIRLDKNYSNAYFMRGKVYYTTAEYDRAIVDWHMVKVINRGSYPDIDMLIEDATLKLSKKL